jgi:hypothetical protein
MKKYDDGDHERTPWYRSFMAKKLPPPTCKVPAKLDWRLNASTGEFIANIGPVTRLKKWRGGGLYRAEYWGDHSFDFPIGSNAGTAKKALADLCQDVEKLRRGTTTVSKLRNVPLSRARPRRR